EVIEILRAIGCHDADRADPAAAIRLACHPGKPHRQLALFEVAAGLRRATQCGDIAGQCDAEGGGTKQRQTAESNRSHKPQFGSFPSSPKTTVKTRSGNG